MYSEIIPPDHYFQAMTFFPGDFLKGCALLIPGKLGDQAYDIARVLRRNGKIMNPSNIFTMTSLVPKRV